VWEAFYLRSWAGGIQPGSKEKTMSTEENMSIERRILDELNRGNLDILDEVHSPSLVYHGTPDLAWDRAQIKAALQMMHAAFPDWKMLLDDLFAADDKVALRVTCQGTHLGELWGIAPTHKIITWTAILIDRFADGKIVEEWEEMDFLGLQQQLGLIHAPAAA
jgi:predicted ester cyclase